MTRACSRLPPSGPLPGSEERDGWIEEGLKEGRAEMFLELLETRFVVPASTRKRIEVCTDAAQIKAWFKRAVSAPSLDEVFAELQ